MEYSKIIKEVGRGKNHARDLDEETARALYARMLNGEVPELLVFLLYSDRQRNPQQL